MTTNRAMRQRLFGDQHVIHVENGFHDRKALADAHTPWSGSEVVAELPGVPL